VKTTLGAAVTAALVLGAATASAHLMAAEQGTVNVVGAAVYAVVSVPTAALHDADDNHDGVLDVYELDRHEAALRAEVDRRLSIFDGATEARTVRVDLVLSPQHDSAGDRADQIVALKHAVLDAPPSNLRVRCDLFTTGALKITATRHPESGTEIEIAVLRAGATEHVFFPQVAPAPRHAGGWMALGAAAFAAMVLARRTRHGFSARAGGGMSPT
jgi:hypothetical protein